MVLHSPNDLQTTKLMRLENEVCFGKSRKHCWKKRERNSKVFQGGEKWGLFGGGPVTLYLDEKLLNFLVRENRVKFGQLPV